ncbi:hypothetical protein BDQ17DRAFT_1337819 [Cyathus striatus]|nr:hypothetical protein BDQ17DRAFT_1337819 [Cyathus striatus]
MQVSSVLRHPLSNPLRAWQSRDTKIHRNIYCLSLYVFILLCLIVTVLTVGIKFQVNDFTGVDLSDTNSSVSRNADLSSVDPLASTLLMRWYITGDSCFDDTSDSSCGPVDIYFDTNSGDVERTNQGETLPLFTWYLDQYNKYNKYNNIELMFPNFGTTLPLPDSGTTQFYPFDVLYGMENTTEVATMVNIAVGYTYGVVLTRLGISGFEITFDSTVRGSYINFIQLERSGLIKAYVISIVIGIWLITFVFLGSVMKIVFGYGQPKEALAVPIATLFAFTTLRGTMPGAPPGFGTVIGN